MSEAIPPTPDMPPPPPGAVWVLPKEPQAITAMILGIVALAGGVVCYLPILLGPVALVMGRRSLRAIKQNPNLGGSAEATTGFVLGIIATVLLVLGVLALAALIGSFIAFPDFWES